VWLNRVHGYEVASGEDRRTVHFPRSCLHCEDAGLRHRLPDRRAYKRAEDGIVLVNPKHLHRLQALLLGLPLWRARI
jgi:sulfite dehydrogenase (quinone) subunit SoeB